MENHTYDEFIQFLNENDKEDNCGIVEEPEDSKRDEFKNNFHEKFCKDDSNKYYAVLGIDIFKYSKFDYEEQKLIPVLFKYLLRTTIRHVTSHEDTLKYFYENNLIEERFVDTGDGGFLIFDNPLDAIIFSIYFYATLHCFNSYHAFPVLRKLLGKIVIRSAVTYERIYQIENNFYGPGIINNARIMSRDKLDRFLIDEKTYDWFLKNTNGIENLLSFSKSDLFELKEFEEKGIKKDKLETLVFNKEIQPVIRNIFCQKLENINVKNEDFSVYSLIVQYHLIVHDDKGCESNITSTMGNLNCVGI